MSAHSFCDKCPLDNKHKSADFTGIWEIKWVECPCSHLDACRRAYEAGIQHQKQKENEELQQAYEIPGDGMTEE